MNAQSSTRIRLGVVALGKIPEILPKSIAAHISGYLNLNTDVLPSRELPSYAFKRERLQYDAGIILKHLEQEHLPNYEKIIAVVAVDLFVPIFTHVFGEAKQGGKCGLVSVYRLNDEQDDSAPLPPLLLERAAKVSLHETGHLLNLVHCTDGRCLMHFSGKLADLDGMPLYFCRYCGAYLRDFLKQ
jgi:archaemetzincin